MKLLNANDDRGPAVFLRGLVLSRIPNHICSNSLAADQPRCTNPGLFDLECFDVVVTHILDFQFFPRHTIKPPLFNVSIPSSSHSPETLLFLERLFCYAPTHSSGFSRYCAIVTISPKTCVSPLSDTSSVMTHSNSSLHSQQFLIYAKLSANSSPASSSSTGQEAAAATNPASNETGVNICDPLQYQLQSQKLNLLASRLEDPISKRYIFPFVPPNPPINLQQLYSRHDPLVQREQSYLTRVTLSSQSATALSSVNPDLDKRLSSMREAAKERGKHRRMVNIVSHAKSHTSRGKGGRGGSSTGSSYSHSYGGNINLKPPLFSGTTSGPESIASSGIENRSARNCNSRSATEERSSASSGSLRVSYESENGRDRKKSRITRLGPVNQSVCRSVERSRRGTKRLSSDIESQPLVLSPYSAPKKTRLSNTATATSRLYQNATAFSKSRNSTKSSHFRRELLTQTTSSPWVENSSNNIKEVRRIHGIDIYRPRSKLRADHRDALALTCKSLSGNNSAEFDEYGRLLDLKFDYNLMSDLSAKNHNETKQESNIKKGLKDSVRFMQRHDVICKAVSKEKELINMAMIKKDQPVTSHNLLIDASSSDVSLLPLSSAASPSLVELDAVPDSSRSQQSMHSCSHSSLVSTANLCPSNSQPQPLSVTQQNKSTIRNVTHQALLKLGMNKKHPEFDATFEFLVGNVVFGFRLELSKEIIPLPKVQVTVEKVIDMHRCSIATNAEEIKKL